MDGGKTIVEKLFTFKQVMKIGSGMLGAGGTVTSVIYGFLVQPKLRLTDVYTLIFGFKIIQKTRSG